MSARTSCLLKARPLHFDLPRYLAARGRLVNRALDRLLPPATTKPATIHKAMRYSLFAGGKRLRPILCLAAAEACGGRAAQALPLACAVECIHTYSLIHDDLPAMDNDDLRRGRPTNHKVFGEAMAILAGDGLLTEAFSVLAHDGKAAPRTVRLVRELAAAAGPAGMVGGQAADLDAERNPASKVSVELIHALKTSRMIEAEIGRAHV